MIIAMAAEVGKIWIPERYHQRLLTIRRCQSMIVIQTITNVGSVKHGDDCGADTGG